MKVVVIDMQCVRTNDELVIQVHSRLETDLKVTKLRQNKYGSMADAW